MIGGILIKGGSCVTLLTDRSKVFDCIDFFISKLEAYGFIHEAFAMQNYLSDKTHRKKKKNCCCSSFFNLLVGVPQGSILGLLLFYIYICDLFFFIEEETMNSYADGTTHFSNGTKVVLNDMENKTSNVFDWFSKNYLKANPGKSNLLLT